MWSNLYGNRSMYFSYNRYPNIITEESTKKLWEFLSARDTNGQGRHFYNICICHMCVCPLFSDILNKFFLKLLFKLTVNILWTFKSNISKFELTFPLSYESWGYYIVWLIFPPKFSSRRILYNLHSGQIENSYWFSFAKSWNLSPAKMSSFEAIKQKIKKNRSSFKCCVFFIQRLSSKALGGSTKLNAKQSWHYVQNQFSH